MAYVPILKGKEGEFLALGHAAPEVRTGIRPVMEVVPDPDLRDLLETFCDHAMEYVPNGMVLTVDCGALPSVRVLQGDVGGPIVRLAESLGLRGVPLCPVIRVTDPDEVLAEAAYAIAQHQQGACLRVITGADACAGQPDGRQIHALLDALQVDPEEVDLLIDAGPIPSARRREELAEAALTALKWFSGRPWRTECVASGAFPVNLAGFPRGQATPVAREDARLWQQVAAQRDGDGLDFGDFGITHPRMPPPSRGTPDPNMRYTTADDWQVFVYPRTRSGNDDFFMLSRDLVASPYWPPTGAGTSWGDAQLQACARHERPKAGGGREWRAWATSHHLAVVTSNLETLGHP
ncbi:hypothetical protein AB0I82_17180 [Streptomyces sp. NPDC050315]|uniref:beta family protein n=1 Tax=Streptomyces sp. NPDC050315 TaxID=3155039 RepID=UPI0034376817